MVGPTRSATAAAIDARPARGRELKAMRATIERLDTKDSEAPGITVRVGRDAANEAHAHAGAPDALDALQGWLGPPRPAFRRVVFEGYDPVEGAALGRTIATTRILRAVPSFVQGVEVAWATLTADQRAAVIGYHPAMLAVLVDEATTLRGINHRYVARARAESVSREARDAAVHAAARRGRAACDQALHIARRWVPSAYLARAPLPEAVGGVDELDTLAAHLESLASWIARWRATWPDDADACRAYESVGLGEGLAHGLQSAASSIRETQTLAAAAADVSPAALRELACQDGRVLHVMNLIHAAFREAAVGDPAVMVPELGEVATVLERPWKSDLRPEARIDSKAPSLPPEPDAR